MAQIMFSTGLYRRTHGKSPKGWGMWMFRIKFFNDGEVSIDRTGTLAGAKKQAVEYIKEQIKANPERKGIYWVEVMP